MIRLIPLSLVTTLLLPLTLAGQISLTQQDGTISGLGHAASHDFPVVIETFEITVGPIDSAGRRTITVEIPSKAITTNNFMRDAHLHTRTIKVRKHPWITFVVTTRAQLVPGTATLTGQLTLNGITNEQTVEVTISEQDGRLRAEGSLVIIPTAFGLPLVVMGPMKVQDYVDLYFNLELPAQ
ncbi:MAG: YceI family protein [Candidatus Marinimicrobia bacterium]|nr:YceI family protein [Candidatus Neomarinimicrobiota bacterium]